MLKPKFRVKKCCGWNKFRIQRRKRIFFSDYGNKIYRSKALAEAECLILNDEV